MKKYEHPRNYFLKDYHSPLHLQGTGEVPLPIVPNCSEEGSVCAATTLGFSCVDSDWLVLFELVNTHCQETPNPLLDLNCQIVENGVTILSGCTLQEVCNDQGCSGGALYQVFCPDNANPDDCDSSDTINVQCNVGGNQACDNQNL